jgi:hypothetical protein
MEKILKLNMLKLGMASLSKDYEGNLPFDIGITASENFI